MTKKAGDGGRRKAARYHDLELLTAAVADAVREEIAGKLGRPLEAAEERVVPAGQRSRLSVDADIEHIVRYVGASEWWDDQRRASKARELLEEAAELAPHRASEIRAVAEDLPALERKRSPRSLIADPLRMRGPLFWWGADGPTPRDLALISLAAGHFPSSVRDEDKLRRGVSVGDVIRAEAKALRTAWDRSVHT